MVRRPLIAPAARRNFQGNTRALPRRYNAGDGAGTAELSRSLLASSFYREILAASSNIDRYVSNAHPCVRGSGEVASLSPKHGEWNDIDSL